MFDAQSLSAMYYVHYLHKFNGCWCIICPWTAAGYFPAAGQLPECQPVSALESYANCWTLGWSVWYNVKNGEICFATELKKLKFGTKESITGAAVLNNFKWHIIGFTVFPRCYRRDILLNIRQSIEPYSQQLQIPGLLHLNSRTFPGFSRTYAFFQDFPGLEISTF